LPLTPDATRFNSVVAAVKVSGDIAKSSVVVVGSSLGDRTVLELARPRRVRCAIALDTRGFWHGWEWYYVFARLMEMVKQIRLETIEKSLLRIHSISCDPRLSDNLSALTQLFDDQETRSWAEVSNFQDILLDLTSIPPQMGPAAANFRSVTIGWGRQDKVSFPSHPFADGLSRFQVTMVRRCGNFPIWDQPSLTVKFILECLDQERHIDEQRAPVQEGI
jgi:pimeloyl-ACP methyl ester carboxylesterase